MTMTMARRRKSRPHQHVDPGGVEQHAVNDDDAAGPPLDLDDDVIADATSNNDEKKSSSLVVRCLDADVAGALAAATVEAGEAITATALAEQVVVVGNECNNNNITANHVFGDDGREMRFTDPAQTMPPTVHHRHRQQYQQSFPIQDNHHDEAPATHFARYHQHNSHHHQHSNRTATPHQSAPPSVLPAPAYHEFLPTPHPPPMTNPNHNSEDTTMLSTTNATIATKPLATTITTTAADTNNEKGENLRDGGKDATVASATNTTTATSDICNNIKNNKPQYHSEHDHERQRQQQQQYHELAPQVFRPHNDHPSQYQPQLQPPQYQYMQQDIHNNYHAYPNQYQHQSHAQQQQYPHQQQQQQYQHQNRLDSHNNVSMSMEDRPPYTTHPQHQFDHHQHPKQYPQNYPHRQNPQQYQQQQFSSSPWPSQQQQTNQSYPPASHPPLPSDQPHTIPQQQQQQQQHWRPSSSYPTNLQQQQPREQHYPAPQTLPPPTTTTTPALPSNHQQQQHNHHTPLPPEEILPVYRYTTNHRTKSWEDMIIMFHEFVKRNGHGNVIGEWTMTTNGSSSSGGENSKKKGQSVTMKKDVEEGSLSQQGDKSDNTVIIDKSDKRGNRKDTHNDKDDTNAENNTNTSIDGSESNDTTMKLQEVDEDAIVDTNEEVVNADDVEQEGDVNDDDDDRDLTLQSWIREVRWVIRAEGLDHPQNDTTNSDSQRIRQMQQQHQRCDSENVTEERLAQLQSISHFPLYSIICNGGGNENGRTSIERDGSKTNSCSNHYQQQQRYRSAFQWWLDDLMHYRAKHDGDCNVPLKYAEYPGLGNFVNRQRSEYRKFTQGKGSSLTLSKMRQLDRVNFVWSVRAGGQTSWECRFLELQAFHRSHGHANVPKSYPPNPPLGYWVNEQRSQYKSQRMGKSSYMNYNKIEKLNSLNFTWSMRNSKRSWEEWMVELKRYKDEHGHVNVPLKYEPNLSLGSFVNNQRTKYRLYQSEKKSKDGEGDGRSGHNTMTEEMIRDLEDLGFVWNLRTGK